MTAFRIKAEFHTIICAENIKALYDKRPGCEIIAIDGKDADKICENCEAPISYGDQCYQWNGDIYTCIRCGGSNKNHKYEMLSSPKIYKKDILTPNQGSIYLKNNSTFWELKELMDFLIDYYKKTNSIPKRPKVYKHFSFLDRIKLAWKVFKNELECFNWPDK